MWLAALGLPRSESHAVLPGSPTWHEEPTSDDKCGEVKLTIRVRRNGTSCPNPPQRCDFSADDFSRSHCLPLPLDQRLTDVLRGSCHHENWSAQRQCLRQNGAAILAPTHRHNRCAVVSSGGAMLGSGCGAQIDSDYDAVFRTNCPVLKGYEQDVGTRTDIMIENSLISKTMAHGSHTVPVPPGETGQPRPLWQDGTVAILTGYARLFTGNTLDRISAEYNATYVAVLDSFDSLFKDPRASSTGLVGIFQAMRLCDQVDLFGFADTGGSISYHCMQLRFEPGRELTPAANLQLTFGCPSIGTDWEPSISTGQHENRRTPEAGVDLEHRFIRRLTSEPVPVCRPSASTK